MFKDKTIQQYNDLLASKSPTPGGGSALPVVGAVAVSLAEMAANVTLAKYADYEYAEQLTQAAKVLGMCKNKLYSLADEDSVAFEGIVAAMRLPKDNEQQREQRRNALEKQYHKAALVPIEVMQVCRRAVDCIEKCMPYFYAYVASDAVIGVDLLKAVIADSKHNVLANTSLLSDQTLKHRLEREADLALS